MESEAGDGPLATAVAACAGGPAGTSSAAGPIGVFDSGLGGLSVLRALRAAMPHDELLYVADSGHAPYGDREPPFIVERAVRMADVLCGAGARALVVACNTATVMAVDQLRARHAVPVIAMEPAIKPAVALARSGVIAVLATSRTLQSEAVARLVREYGGGVRILLQACPGLVEQVERGAFDSDETMRLLQAYVRPAVDAGADTLVLGCTHYPFLAAQIQAVAGASVRLVDAADAVARQVLRRVALSAVPPTGAPAGRTRFFTTGDPVVASPLMSRLWGTPVLAQPLDEIPMPTSRSP